MSTQLMVRQAQLSMRYDAGERARAEYARDCADEHRLNKITTTETKGCLDEFRRAFGPTWAWSPEGEYLTGVKRSDASLGASWLSRESRRFTGAQDWRDAWAMNQWIEWDLGNQKPTTPPLLTTWQGDTNLDLHRWVWRKYMDRSLRMDGAWSVKPRPKRGTHGGDRHHPGPRGIDTVHASVPILRYGLVEPNPRDYDQRIDHWGLWVVYPAAELELAVLTHLSSAVQAQGRWTGFGQGVASHRAATAAIGARLQEKRVEARRKPNDGGHGTIRGTGKEAGR